MAYSPLSSLGGSSSGGDHYDPNQPRVPAGQSGAGRWTRVGALLRGRDIDLQGEERFGASDQPDASLPKEAVQLAFSGSESNTLFRPPVSRRLFKPQSLQAERAIALYELLSARNGPDSQAILELHLKESKFTAFGFARKESEAFVFTHASADELTQEEVRKRCDSFDEVQQLLDEKYRQVLKENPDFSRAQIGSRWHREMKAAIDAKGDDKLRGEVSYQDGGKEPKPDEPSNYGKPGTIRPDLREIVMGGAVERLSPTTACFYEFSIGQQYMGKDRAVRIGQMTRNAFPGVTQIVVTQMRPTGWMHRQ